MSRKAAPEQWGPYAKALGIEIQRRRIEAGLSQEQLAYAAGLTRSHFQALEKGLSRLDTPANPSILTLVAVAQVLETTVGGLMPEGVPDVTAWK